MFYNTHPDDRMLTIRPLIAARGILKALFRIGGLATRPSLLSGVRRDLR